MPEPWDPYADEVDDDGGEFEEDDLSCSLDDEGRCDQAGTEWCEFDCPNRLD